MKNLTVLLLFIMLVICISQFDYDVQSVAVSEQENKLPTKIVPLIWEWTPKQISYYNIPLSYDLQYYTYIRCNELNILEYYEVVLAIMWQESNFTATVISKTDDYGIMQINTVNHEWLSKKLGIDDFLDPYQNIDAGTYIFAYLILKYKDPHKALMAYNYGEAGAKQCWDRNVYTSKYSRNVMIKTEKILKMLESPKKIRKEKDVFFRKSMI